jgi:putative endonuclease
MDPRQVSGARAERVAAAALERDGLRVIERNVRLGGGELDLVCRDGDVWVFVEVKARRPGWDDAPRAAVSWAKQRRLVRLAEAYMKWRGLRDVRCRFDVVEVTIADVPAVHHLRNAFDA